MACGGIDIGKLNLVVAVNTIDETLEVTNDREGWQKIATFLRARQAVDVGLEPSGIYGREVQAYLREAGFRVIEHVSGTVQGYAKVIGQRAKNDHPDAKLIARFTALGDAKPRKTDLRIEALREDMRFPEQVEGDLARWKTRLETYRSTGLRSELKKRIGALRKERDQLRMALGKALRNHEGLARKIALVLSIPGIGERTALALMIYLPELGTLSREQIAALTGVAPYDQDSGQRKEWSWSSPGLVDGYGLRDSSPSVTVLS